MKKVAVFGNAGAGKSTLSKRLADMTGLPLVVLDLLQYGPGGVKVPHEEYKAAHAQLLREDRWIVDGFGSLETVWERLEVADTLIYMDMPLLRHYWWVTKRFLTGLVVEPEGWPENSPLLKGTLQSYRTVGLCHKKLTPLYRQYVTRVGDTKRVHHLQSLQDVRTFYQTVQTDLTQ